MRRLVPTRSVQGGLPPGTLLHVGERRAEKAQLTQIVYDTARVEAHAPQARDVRLPPADQPGVTCINVDGLHEGEVVQGGRVAWMLFTESFPLDLQRLQVEFGDSVEWALHTKSITDRAGRAVARWSEALYTLLQPKAEYLGEAFAAEVIGLDLSRPLVLNKRFIAAS